MDNQSIVANEREKVSRLVSIKKIEHGKKFFNQKGKSFPQMLSEENT